MCAETSKCTNHIRIFYLELVLRGQLYPRLRATRCQILSYIYRKPLKKKDQIKHNSSFTVIQVLLCWNIVKLSRWFDWYFDEKHTQMNCPDLVSSAIFRGSGSASASVVVNNVVNLGVILFHYLMFLNVVFRQIYMHVI